MRNKNIIIWGASTGGLHALLTFLKADNSQRIIGFVEEDETICDVVFMNIPIVNPNRITSIQFDIILIPWWKNVNHVLEIIKKIDANLIKKCMLLDSTYNMTPISNNIEYIKLNSVGRKQVDKHIDLANMNLIAHACGGWIKDKQMLYTNSSDALETALSNGHTVFETDVMDYNGALICAHRLENYLSNIYFGFQNQTIEDFLRHLYTNSELIGILDIKYGSSNEYESIIRKIDFLICQFDSFIKNRILIEVYEEQSILTAYKYEFGVIKTNYRENNIFAHENHAQVCDYYGINNAIVFINKFESISEILYGIELYDKYNINTFAATVNSLDKYRLLKKYGFTGIITDYLYPAVSDSMSIKN